VKTIGMVGGLAWPSTAEYYRIINEETARRMGGSHCAKLIMAQTDFDGILAAQAAGDWDFVASAAASQANILKAAGADFFIIACNTVHAAMPRIEALTDLPYIHIVDPTARIALENGCSTVGLMGSGYTMNGTYFTGRLEDKYGLRVLLPQQSDREYIHAALYGELVKGEFLPRTRDRFMAAAEDMAARGAQAIILGCTEFGLLLKPEDSPLPLIDTASAHARAAVDMALSHI
jgi:aspartate racemase